MRWWIASALAAVIALGAGCRGCEGADRALHRMQEREARPLVEPPPGAVAWGAPGAPDGDLEPAPPVTRELIARGEDRYDVACAQCHGVLGDGDSDVARAMRGRRPPSLVDADAARLSDVRVLAAIEVGYGAMPALANVLQPRDRAAVLAFVRVLQRREVALDELPPPARADALRELDGAASSAAAPRTSGEAHAELDAPAARAWELSDSAPAGGAP